MNRSVFILLFVVGFVPTIVFACSGSVAVQAVTASTFQVGNPPEQAIDGNITSRWSANGEGVFITLDLGKLTKICSVSVAWYQGDTRVNYFDISTSLNGTSFTLIYNGNSSLTTSLQIYQVPVTSARYVRLTFRGNTANAWCSINEINVASGFAHPGILINQAQIDFVRSKVAAHLQPWQRQMDRAATGSRGGQKIGSATYTPGPVGEIKCGQEKPTATDVGCSRSRQDALAAWTLTLRFIYTGNQSYAAAAINVLNAWSSTLQSVPFSVSDISVRNGLLNAAWLGEMFTRSAEVLRHTNSGWAPADALRFQNMLTNLIQPLIYNGWNSNGNWDASVSEALVNIGIFADNRTTFEQGLKIWRARLPWYFYITSDGVPSVPPGNSLYTYWNQTVFDSRLNGLCQETCRDFGHTQMGLAAMVNTAESAYQQGVDLYAEGKDRFLATLEFQSRYLNLNSETCESYLCLGKIRAVDDLPAWEIAYNHYSARLGYSLPQTTTLVNRLRANGPEYTDLMMAWDTLTHAQTGWAGLP